MVYSFGLTKHANIRYREVISRLGRCELLCMLKALSLSPDVQEESLGGASFLTFSCRKLTESELQYLSGHSAVVFMAQRTEDGFLYPLDIPSADYLPEDLPEVLKYKGKTGASFTRMMLNMAVSLRGCPSEMEKITAFDPLCGKGTSCFCALQAGMNAVGLDLDRKAVREAVDYFSRYLRIHGLKHTMNSRSETAQKDALPLTEFVFAAEKEQYLAGNTRRLTLAVGDTGLSPALFRKRKAQVILADLPYGVQHAPRFGQVPESFPRLLERALPLWRNALDDRGVIALSFNTLTLPTHSVVSLLEKAGFSPFSGSVFDQMTHEVEQAVVRNVVLASKNAEVLYDDRE